LSKTPDCRTFLCFLRYEQTFGKNMKLYGPLQKIEEQDDGTVRIVGIASSQSVDSVGEIILASAMKAALPDFMRFGGTGALREMHQLKAAGRVDEAYVDDDGFTHITATIVDFEACRKTLLGVYKGFSVGGKIVSRDHQDRTIITGIKLAECSLVDRPCNPDSVFQIAKAEGINPDDEDASVANAEDSDLDLVIKKITTATVESPQEETQVVDDKAADGVEKRAFSTKEREADAKSGAALKDGSFPILNKQDLRNAIQAYGRAKNKAVAKRHIISRAKALGADDLIPDDWKDTKKVDLDAAEPGDQLAKAGEPAAPINPSTVEDVLRDGAGNADSQTPGAVPVAGATVIANYPPGDSKGADTSHSANPATAGNSGQDSLSTTDTPVVEHQTAATPTQGTDTRTRTHPDASKAADSDPISAAATNAAEALKFASSSVDKATRAAGLNSVPAPLRDGVALRKGIPEVAHLGYVLSELAMALAMAKSEAEWEGDGSPVPAKLQKALVVLADAYKAMSDEELQEMMDHADGKCAGQIAVALAGGDVVKAFSVAVGDDALAKLAPISDILVKAEGRIATLESERVILLKVSADLTEGLQILGKRVEELSAMPMSPKTLAAGVPLETVVKAVTKEEDTAGITKADHSAISMSPEDFQKAWDAMPADLRADLSLRASLQRPISINR
jgi:hypothetical protein